MSHWGITPTTAHPIRAPWVRDRSFRDNGLPTPDEFFDRTQQHVGDFFGCTTGRTWSRSQDEFDNDAYPTGYLGKLRITVNTDDTGAAAGLTLAPVTDATGLVQQGEHGVWSGLSGAAPFKFEMRSGLSWLGPGDVLLTCRVKIRRRAGLNGLEDSGLRIGLSDDGVGLPAFCAGGDAPNWYVWSQQKEGGTSAFWDTGVPITDGRWYDLQISRVNGAMRCFINGAPIFFLTGIAGLIAVRLAAPVEGFYLPQDFQQVRRYFQIRRWSRGPANDGFLIDNFHLLLQRTE